MDDFSILKKPFEELLHWTTKWTPPIILSMETVSNGQRTESNDEFCTKNSDKGPQKIDTISLTDQWNGVNYSSPVTKYKLPVLLTFIQGENKEW